MKRFYIVLMLVGLFGLSLASVSADPGYGINILSVDGDCDYRIVSFRFDNFSSPVGTVTINMTLSTSSKELVASDSEDFFLDYETDYTFEIPLTPSLTTGSYVVILEVVSDGVVTSYPFDVTCGEGVSTSTSKPVELPPCEIEDTRLDEGCGSTFVVTYVQAREDGCYISIYSPYGRADGKPVLLLQVTPAEIAAAQAVGGTAVIDSTDVVNLTNVTVYWLPETGEFQVNAGPNEEGKVYVLNFTGCPATNIYTTNSYQNAD